jgi:hypothetical protein
MNNKVLLTIGVVLLLLGLVRPNITLPINNPNNNSIVVVTPPQDLALRDKCKLVIDVLNNGPNDRKQDGARLCDLYMDLATLIELDSDKEAVKTTEEIRQANALSGPMLRMNIQGKYPGLSDAAQEVIVNQIGSDIVPLDAELRKKSVEAFRALAWACNEGSK